MYEFSTVARWTWIATSSQSTRSPPFDKSLARTTDSALRFECDLSMTVGPHRVGQTCSRQEDVTSTTMASRPLLWGSVTDQDSDEWHLVTDGACYAHNRAERKGSATVLIREYRGRLVNF